MSDTPVRFATLQDAAAVANLHLIASRALYEGVVPEAHWQSTPPAKRLAFWKEAIEFGEPQVMVATEGQEVVGFVGFDRSRDPKSKNTTGEIWTIYVDPDRLGEGVGLALWDAANEELQEEGCTDVTVWVPLRSDRALRFFDAAGFKREMNTARTVPMGGVKVEELRLKRALG
jgi:ribosomal protein S18 acetylase RimI-like enzyme